VRKTLLALVAGFMVMLSFTGCGEGVKDVAGYVNDHKESIYKTGKKAVQVLVPDETREKYHTKELDKAVTTGYDIYKDVKNKEKK